MNRIARLARPEDAALFVSRHAFNCGFSSFETWFYAQTQPAPEEVWHAFNQHLGATFALQSETIWSCGVHPQQRTKLARLFCEVARAKMELDPAGDPLLDVTETRLWGAALRVSPRAVIQWQRTHLERNGELGFGFAGVKHRLADLCRRASRTDGRAMRLYIEAFVGPNASLPSRLGTSAHQSLATLLERGATLSSQSAIEEVQARYGLCLLLWNRGWRAPWVETSLHLARQRWPATREQLHARWNSHGSSQR